jgi:glyoxylase-like metal-dependent hydrolase (beta-lactamase superfamily II)
MGGVHAKSTARSAAELNKISHDLYELEGDGGNVAVYLTDEGVIVVDEKFERNYGDIMANIKKLSDKPVKYVLNTHQHGDHTGSNEKMKANRVQVTAHRNALANMVAGKQPGLPHVTFTNQEQVYLGGKEVDAYYNGRGHTNGDVVIYFPALRVLHTGDLSPPTAKAAWSRRLLQRHGQRDRVDQDAWRRSKAGFRYRNSWPRPDLKEGRPGEVPCGLRENADEHPQFKPPGKEQG